MKASLLRRMILAQGLVLLLGWLIAWAVTLGTLYGSKKGLFDDSMELTASALANLLQDEADPARFELQARRIQALDETFTRGDDIRPGEYRGVYQVFDREGRLLFRSATAPEAPLTTAGPGFHSVPIGGQSWRVFVKADPGNRLRVLVAQPRSFTQRIIWRSILKSPVQFVIAFLVVAVLTWLVARRALRPLRELARSVEARNPGDLSPLSERMDLAETRPLIAALNGLFQRVRDLLETQRRFVADAAHELRTPLAVIAAQAHVLQQAREEVPREQAARDLQRGVDRAAQLVGQLLSVARLDAAAQSVEKAPFDLAGLLRERVGMLVRQAAARSQDLGYEGPDALAWVGDSAVLASAVDNLLANALRYTPPGGSITLRLQESGDAVTIEVEDTGPGVPSECRESMFERFRRLPGTTEAGSGLGLAIVRRAVELHGGRVWLEDGSAAPGLRAVVQLPRAEA